MMIKKKQFYFSFSLGRDYFCVLENSTDFFIKEFSMNFLMSIKKVVKFKSTKPDLHKIVLIQRCRISIRYHLEGIRLIIKDQIIVKTNIKINFFINFQFDFLKMISIEKKASNFHKKMNN